MANLDLVFISGEFDFQFSKDKKYLLKYFKTDLQKSVLKYYFTFNSLDNFVDHTGLKCRREWLLNLYNKLQGLEAIHKEARDNKNMSLLAIVESGKYKFPKKPRKYKIK